MEKPTRKTNVDDDTLNAEFSEVKREKKAEENDLNSVPSSTEKQKAQHLLSSNALQNHYQELNKKTSEEQKYRLKFDIIQKKISEIENKLNTAEKKKKQMKQQLLKNDLWVKRVLNVYRPIFLALFSFAFLIAPFMPYFLPILLLGSFSAYSSCALQVQGDKMEKNSVKFSKDIYYNDKDIEYCKEDLRAYKQEQKSIKEKINQEENKKKIDLEKAQTLKKEENEETELIPSNPQAQTQTQNNS